MESRNYLENDNNPASEQPKNCCWVGLEVQEEADTRYGAEAAHENGAAQTLDKVIMMVC